MILRLNLILVLAIVVCGALWIERGHQVVIEAAADDAFSAAAAAVCPENDTMPYDARCLEYLNVTEPAVRLQATAALAAPAPCPDNDRLPYSPSCIAFMQGATETGMRWRATAGAPSIPAPQ